MRPLASHFPALMLVLVLSGVAHAQPTQWPLESDWWPAGDLPDGPDPHAPRLLPIDPNGDPRIGFSRIEGFRLRSEDGDFMLRIALHAGFKFDPAWTDGKSRTNDIFPFLRPILVGNLFKPWLAYVVAMELARPDPFLLAAFVDVRFVRAIGLRFGQQPTPVSRHELLTPPQLFFPDYASVATYFWSGRSRGLMFFGTLPGESLDYFAGVFSGTPLNAPINLSENYIAEARLTVNPMGSINLTELPFTPTGEALPLRVSFTVQGYYGKLQSDPRNYNFSDGVALSNIAINTDRIGTASADTWFQWGPAIVFGEFYWRKIRPLRDAPSFTSLGAWGQAMLDVYRHLLGVGVRMNWLNPNTSVASDSAYETEAQLAYFIHPPALVLKLRYGWIHQHTPANPSAAPLPFPVGRSNLATLQLTLAF